MSEHPWIIPTPHHPDDALMILCCEVEEAHQALDEFTDEDWERPEYIAAKDVAADTRARLIRAPARTLEGALAKAAAVAEVYKPDDLDEAGIERAVEEHGESVEALLVSLLADLHRLQRPAQAIKAAREESPYAQQTLLTSYRTWLACELQALEREAPHLRGLTWTDCRASAFFGFPTDLAPPPSTRASHVLDALGIDWRADVAEIQAAQG